MRERCEGLVVRKRVGTGSKSERVAVVLKTADAELVLRREGGNAFSDPQLEALVGMRIRAVGRRVDYTFIVKTWVVVPSLTSSA